MARAWDVTWSRFFLPRTHLPYDYLSSYEPGRELAHLPPAGEITRGPMGDDAAADVTGRREYLDLGRRCLDPALEQSLSPEDRQPTSAWLQMQGSLELLEALEKDADRMARMRPIMAGLSARCAARAATADRAAAPPGLTAVGPDWRTSGGRVCEYRKAWHCIRESGEADGAFPAAQQPLLAAGVRVDCARVSICRIFRLLAAGWRARRRGPSRTEETTCAA